MSNPIVPPNQDSDNLKQCKKCGERKPATAEYFRVGKDSKDGLRAICRVCHRAENKRYREENPEKIRAASRKYRLSNLDKLRENSRQYQRANPDRAREIHERWKQANPGVPSERVRQWRLDNPEKFRAHNRAAGHRRRARKINNGGTHTAEDVRAQYNSQRGKCWWCGKKVGETYHVDHRIPLSRGGSNAPENLVIACPKCNLSKNDKLPHEWSDRLL